MEALRSTPDPTSPPTSTADTSAMDTGNDAESEVTFTANTTTASSSAISAGPGPKSILKKKGKPKLTAKEKKERGLFVEKIVSTLPLEFRGSDVNLRRQIELVVEGFLDRDGRGVARALQHSTSMCTASHLWDQCKSS